MDDIVTDIALAERAGGIGGSGPSSSSPPSADGPVVVVLGGCRGQPTDGAAVFRGGIARFPQGNRG